MDHPPHTLKLGQKSMVWMDNKNEAQEFRKFPPFSR